MEVLRKMITTTVSGGLSSLSLRSRNDGEIHISHLLFVDDT